MESMLPEPPYPGFNDWYKHYHPVRVDPSLAWKGPAGGHLEGEVKIGGEYLVPQIRGRTGRFGPVWIPVRGTGHEDQDVFDFPHWHWHIDLRFANGELHDALVKQTSAEVEIDKLVLSTDKVRPIVGKKARLMRDRSKRYYLNRGRPVPYTTGFLLLDHPCHTWQRTSFMRCMRTDPLPRDIETESHRRNAMQRQHQGRGWMDSMRCPHRGASLRGVPCDENGLVRCPLHELVLNARTGKVATVDEAKAARGTGGADGRTRADPGSLAGKRD